MSITSETVKKIEQELAEAKSAVSEKDALHKECVTEVATLEKSIYDHANNRERILKDIEKKIKTVKTKMQSASKDLKGHENEREKLIMEVEAVKQEQTSLENQLVSFQKQISVLTSEVDELKTKVDLLT
ncbi:hypothetical protein M8C21_024471 [Ambrosia artemisiifolia]|uniref:Uncharacterized protein n=1 Tax=Ambrosia artemisiifolia TaxID=4212 RepID=A0AAD5D7L5_AMBAR|nr:hypothetical protein M8C21_024471 [Ambrosia artemisiifolia]